MTADHLRFYLELYDADGLVHLCGQRHVAVVKRVVFRHFRHKLFTGVIAVYVHGEGGQLDEIDAVSVFDGSHVGIT